MNNINNYKEIILEEGDCNLFNNITKENNKFIFKDETNNNIVNNFFIPVKFTILIDQSNTFFKDNNWQFINNSNLYINNEKTTTEIKENYKIKDNNYNFILEHNQFIFEPKYKNFNEVPKEK
ncbi:hypothetical protein ABK040_014960 [Willaertia magna]